MRDPFRQRHPDAPKTRQDIEDELTEANARKPFEEFPKHIYHPDASLAVGHSIDVQVVNKRGETRVVTIRARVVTTKAEQAAAGSEWLEKPQEAVDVIVKRDEKSSDEFIAKVNAEAEAIRKKAFDDAVAAEVARQLKAKPKAT